MPTSEVTATWTRYTVDQQGKRSNYRCAHCEHSYGGFDYIAVIEHCRTTHPDFYQKMWDTERVPTSMVDPKFHPIKKEKSAMPDLSPVDLKNGYTLVFQRSQKDSTVRAVIKSSTGNIVVRGTVVPEARALASSRSCMMSQTWMDILSPPVVEESEDDNYDYDDVEVDEDDIGHDPNYGLNDDDPADR